MRAEAADGVDLAIDGPQSAELVAMAALVPVGCRACLHRWAPDRMTRRQMSGSVEPPAQLRRCAHPAIGECKRPALLIVELNNLQGRQLQERCKPRRWQLRTGARQAERLEARQARESAEIQPRPLHHGVGFMRIAEAEVGDREPSEAAEVAAAGDGELGEG